MVYRRQFAICMSRRIVELFVCLAFVLPIAGSDNFEHDFYSVLELNKKASQKEIREAYKDQARKWHPELNPSEDASYRFHLINEAYRTLSDPEKKSLYEVFGKGSSDIETFLREDDGLQGDGFYLVTSNYLQSTSSNLWTVTSKYFDKIVKPESYRHPFLLFVSSEKCEPCKEMKADWLNWCHALALEGVKCGLISMEEERYLLRRLRAPRLKESEMVGVLEGKPIWAADVSSSLQELRQFVVGLFGGDLVPELDGENYVDFLESCSREKNRVALIFFTNSYLPPLVYYTSLFYSKSHISGGYVRIKNPLSKHSVEKFNISANKPSLLVFREDPNDPVFKLSLKSFKKDHVDQIIAKHLMLGTPRISCPLMFDLVCPLDSPRTKKKLCVILLTSSDPKFELHLTSFKSFSASYANGERVKFGYVFVEKQARFVRLVTWGKDIYNSSSNSFKVMVVWRRDANSLNYEFLEEGWHDQGANLRRARGRLVQLLEWLLNSPSALSNVVELKKEISNEHLKTLWRRILVRLRDWTDGCVDYILGVDDATYLTAAKSVVFVVALGLVFRYLAVKEIQTIMGPETSTQVPPRCTSPPEKPVIYVHMLGDENYRALVTESPAAVRLILLLVDSASRERLIKYFGAFLRPYVRSKAFKFAFVDLDRYFPWYEQLLDTTLRQSDQYQALKKNFASINVKNCLGTVLAINGIKKYYFMYHISSFKAFPNKERDSEEESDDGGIDDVAFEEYRIGTAWGAGLSKRGNREASPAEGQSKDIKPKDVDKFFEFDLLRGLGVWLEKLCQGKLKKFRVSQWPKSLIVQ